ncbi:methionine ABC transporter permease [Sporosarcina pasteurii]|uniref:Methionine import system permease protein MetP n=1 Tax=Sporosarcina pasteurii TaxID=1474 RepID=A0A380C464_SPOPA|nr:methionine ABC transporter permease [Sporosarcina pasteurii]MDS9471618.1 methionine ABC transporter permease [Sporosarcina pasteurii]QBQ04772.1 ABC transporter permease [Sporosarcina pasteurii]SUJ11399.1 Methionine import system permease protein MetP [Sporosarcina pasteurii]
MSPELFNEFGIAFLETAWMLAISVTFSVLIGVPLGIGLFVTSEGMFWQSQVLQNISGTIINIIRSIPFVILLVVLLPLTKLIVGTSMGPTAASLSLTVAGIPFYARLVENSLREIDKGVIEAAESCGASPWLIIRKVLLPESKSGLIGGLTVTVISLLSYSAMAGMVGGGGIGDLAIRFGYYRYQNEVMAITVVFLIFLVQLIQFLGDRAANAADKR